jgi:hypothetical protein
MLRRVTQPPFIAGPLALIDHASEFGILRIPQLKMAQILNSKTQ